MNIKLIKIANNFSCVDVKDVRLYFSYETLVAVITPWGKAVRENIWGTTTGKHLNMIDSDKSTRLNQSDFDNEVKMLLKNCLSDFILWL